MGRARTYSQSILMTTRASPHPAAMYWGDELVAIYNEAYIGRFAFISVLA
jgi:hypothetical protein